MGKGARVTFWLVLFSRMSLKVDWDPGARALGQPGMSFAPKSPGLGKIEPVTYWLAVSSSKY